MPFLASPLRNPVYCDKVYPVAPESSDAAHADWIVVVKIAVCRAFGPGNVLAGLDDCAGPSSPFFLLSSPVPSAGAVCSAQAAPENI